MVFDEPLQVSKESEQVEETKPVVQNPTINNPPPNNPPKKATITTTTQKSQLSKAVGFMNPYLQTLQVSKESDKKKVFVRKNPSTLAPVKRDVPKLNQSLNEDENKKTTLPPRSQTLKSVSPNGVPDKKNELPISVVIDNTKSAELGNSADPLPERTEFANNTNANNEITSPPEQDLQNNDTKKKKSHLPFVKPPPSLKKKIDTFVREQSFQVGGNNFVDIPRYTGLTDKFLSTHFHSKVVRKTLYDACLVDKKSGRIFDNDAFTEIERIHTIERKIESFNQEDFVQKQLAVKKKKIVVDKLKKLEIQQKQENCKRLKEERKKRAELVEKIRKYRLDHYLGHIYFDGEEEKKPLKLKKKSTKTQEQVPQNTTAVTESQELPTENPTAGAATESQEKPVEETATTQPETLENEQKVEEGIQAEGEQKKKIEKLEGSTQTLEEDLLAAGDQKIIELKEEEKQAEETVSREIISNEIILQKVDEKDIKPLEENLDTEAAPLQEKELNEIIDNDFEEEQKTDQKGPAIIEDDFEETAKEGYFEEEIVMTKEELQNNVEQEQKLQIEELFDDDFVAPEEGIPDLEDDESITLIQAILRGFISLEEFEADDLSETEQTESNTLVQAIINEMIPSGELSDQELSEEEIFNEEENTSISLLQAILTGMIACDEFDDQELKEEEIAETALMVQSILRGRLARIEEETIITKQDIVQVIEEKQEIKQYFEEEIIQVIEEKQEQTMPAKEEKIVIAPLTSEEFLEEDEFVAFEEQTIPAKEEQIAPSTSEEDEFIALVQAILKGNLARDQYAESMMESYFNEEIIENKFSQPISAVQKVEEDNTSEVSEVTTQIQAMLKAKISNEQEDEVVQPVKESNFNEEIIENKFSQPISTVQKVEDIYFNEEIIENKFSQPISTAQKVEEDNTNEVSEVITQMQAMLKASIAKQPEEEKVQPIKESNFNEEIIENMFSRPISTVQKVEEDNTNEVSEVITQMQALLKASIANPPAEEKVQKVKDIYFNEEIIENMFSQPISTVQKVKEDNTNEVSEVITQMQALLKASIANEQEDNTNEVSEVITQMQALLKASIANPPAEEKVQPIKESNFNEEIIENMFSQPISAVQKVEDIYFNEEIIENMFSQPISAVQKVEKDNTNEVSEVITQMQALLKASIANPMKK